MKGLTLEFAERIGLAAFLGQSSGPLGKMTALQRVYDAVRLTDSEMQQVKRTDLGGGMVNVQAPSPEFGRVTAQVEDADAEVLRLEIDSCQGFRISDLKWVRRAKDQLSAPSTPLKEVQN
jgi:hypothetical protein